MPGQAFAHLNLRYNPFGELPWPARAALAVVDTAPLCDWLCGPAPRTVLVVGEMGRGKSTLLWALRAALGQRLAEGAPPLVYLPEDGPLPALPGGPWLLLDEAWRLPRARRRALFRSRARLVLGTHPPGGLLPRAEQRWWRRRYPDLRVELARCGRRPLLREVAGLEVERLCAIAERRISAARRDRGAVPALGRARAADLIARHGDDLRSIEGELYDWIQGLGSQRAGHCAELAGGPAVGSGTVGRP